MATIRVSNKLIKRISILFLYLFPSYSTLALKYHPKVCKDNPSKTYYHFCRVAESYEVLSNKRTRAFYDNWGEEKLKQGIFINEALRKE